MFVGFQDDPKFKQLNKKFMDMRKKGAIEMDMTGWIIIGVIVLVILAAAAIILSGKGSGFIETIKNLFRFGK